MSVALLDDEDWFDGWDGSFVMALLGLGICTNEPDDDCGSDSDNNSSVSEVSVLF